jgi:hypothetical protein
MEETNEKNQSKGLLPDGSAVYTYGRMFPAFYGKTGGQRGSRFNAGSSGQGGVPKSGGI